MTEIWSHSALTDSEAVIVRQIHDSVEEIFKNPRFDASHDFEHVRRVTHNAIAILEQEQKTRINAALSAFNTFAVILGALLHDVEDKKYKDSSKSSEPSVQELIHAVGLPSEFANTMQRLVEGVSYSSEIKNPKAVVDTISEIPELAIVQDADRLDAIGAVGIGRCFTYGGAKSIRSLQDSILHFEEKLLKLEGMMKTETGNAMAAERTCRIREFMLWWENEAVTQS